MSEKTQISPLLQSRVIFVDGECVLCNNWVSFLARHDRKKKLRFTTLQGKTSHELLPKSYNTAISTIIYLRSGKLFFKSGAAIRMIADTAWYWKPSLVLLIIPALIRNAIYDFVARRRFGWFGRKSSCSLSAMPDMQQVLP